MFAAQHARFVRERVLVLKSKFKEAVEPIVLDEEKRLLGISNALGYGDRRDQPIEKQAEAIAQAAAEGAKKMLENKMCRDENLAMKQRLEEANDAMQQTNVKLAEKDARFFEKEAQLSEKNAQLSDKDAQLKILNDKIAQLEEQNKTRPAAKSSRTKIKKLQPQSSAE